MTEPSRRGRTISKAAVGILLAATLLTGCAAAPTSEPTQDGTAETTPSDASPTDASFATLGEITELTTGLVSPWGLTFLPDGSALVSERITGQILRVAADGGNPVPVGTVYASELGHRTWVENNVLQSGLDFGWPVRLRLS